MSEEEQPDALADGVRKALMHFTKAGLEVASGVQDLINSVVATVRPPGDSDGSDPDIERIDIE